MNNHVEVQEAMRSLYPYGKWTCADGREVIFNRYYRPIWQRSADGVVSVADCGEQVAFVTQEWFYTDGSAPWKDYTVNHAVLLTHRACAIALGRWGLKITWPASGVPVVSKT